MSNVGPANPETQRDFIGYGRNPPDADWSAGKRLAVNFVLNYEEGSEPNVPDGDGYSETNLTEGTSSVFAAGARDLGSESMFEYGSRVGVWRILRLFEERRLPLTVYGCAVALERNPEIAAAVRELRHDVCSHGWRWVKHWELGEAEEREHIGRAFESIARSCGEPPAGWYCRYAPSLNTRRLLAEHGGFLYDSDTYNDELPYWRRVLGRPWLVVPYTLATNDTKFMRGAIASGGEFFEYLREAFDLMYDEAARQPKMMSIGLHARISGHAARASGLARFLDHVAARDGAWICRRVEIARHWHARHPMTSENGPR